VFEFLSGNSDAFIKKISEISPSRLGSNVSFFDGENDFSDFKFALLCINETRGNHYTSNTTIDFENIKYELYSLYKGNWNASILDLGVINRGESLSDTYFLVKQITHQLLSKKTIPIILGGSQDLVYPIYRAYDKIKYMLNLVNIDYKFDLGDSNQNLDNSTYLSHMVVEKPYNLFNYSNIGYQSFLNSQEEINLLDRMFFESYRLGVLIEDMKSMEPVIRDADIATVDIRAVENKSLFQDNLNANGISNREICALSRYAGMSDKVTSFGVFELQECLSQTSKTLVAQIVWYFIEGVAYRVNEKVNIDNSNFLRYQVPVEEDTLVFYESQLSGRWWIEIPSDINVGNNKLKQHTLLPCDKKDYLSACNQELPDRWILAKMKNEF
jgi:arginase family enzyme